MSPEEREEFILLNDPFAKYLARQFQHLCDEPFDDLLQVARIGLIKACDQFNPNRGVRFSTFAVPTIRGMLQNYLRDHTRLTGRPLNVRRYNDAILKAKEKLSKQYSRNPTAEEIACEIGVAHGTVLDCKMFSWISNPLSLDDILGVSDGQPMTLLDTVGAVDASYEHIETSLFLDCAQTPLTKEEKVVIRELFIHEKSQIEVGKLLGCSQMQVSRVLRRALKKMRNYLLSIGESG